MKTQLNVTYMVLNIFFDKITYHVDLKYSVFNHLH